MVDWNAREEFFKFTRGRFVVDEKQQMELRKVKFDMNQLACEAAKATGSRECVDIHKFPDGLNNKAFNFIMEDGKEIVGKVPNPCAGIPHYTTASEVATMDFLRNILELPVPKVLAWSSRAEANSVGAEYILMEKLDGIPLERVWRTESSFREALIMVKMIEYQEKLSSVSFSRFGSLYYADDIESPDVDDYLFTDDRGQKISLPNFTIGPSVDLAWVGDGRETVHVDKGPCKSSLVPLNSHLMLTGI